MVFDLPCINKATSPVDWQTPMLLIDVAQRWFPSSLDGHSHGNYHGLILKYTIKYMPKSGGVPLHKEVEAFTRQCHHNYCGLGTTLSMRMQA